MRHKALGFSMIIPAVVVAVILEHTFALSSQEMFLTIMGTSLVACLIATRIWYGPMRPPEDERER